ncbi:MAG: 16S rRNA (cytosine(1402)-N(4))-methyltransferase RsmH [Thermotaleaceae bacterium]
MDFQHVTVLLNETVAYLNIKPNGIYVDGTLGGAGHASKVCESLEKNGLFIGIDQDNQALAVSKERLSKYEVRQLFAHNNFSNIKAVMQELQIDGMDGMVLDLGVSSYQLDEGSRGFSYMQDAPLDMRMDMRHDFSAKDVVNEYEEELLAQIISNYGEEKWAKRIAKFIVDGRRQKTIETTGELVEIIKAAVPAAARRDGPHPAKRTFQAIRIEVNGELEILEKTIRDITNLLHKGGRLCIITFHSLEDRIVKNVFKDLARACKCPPEYPICTCGGKADLKILTKKPILPSDDEVINNPRSRSAKLRVAEKL